MKAVISLCRALGMIDRGLTVFASRAAFGDAQAWAILVTLLALVGWISFRFH
jgi:hypothetical protein